ncbi:hypothetical protein D3C80_1188650 [compost metagenome]
MFKHFRLVVNGGSDDPALFIYILTRVWQVVLEGADEFLPVPKPLWVLLILWESIDRSVVIQ